MRAILAVAVGCAALVGTVCAAEAADLAYPPPETYGGPPPQFEFGTGWYLRGDVSAGTEPTPSENVFGALNANNSDWSYSVGAGFGYKWNSWLRTDVTGEYLQGFSFGTQGTSPAGAFVNGHANFDRYAVLANAYIDLGTYWGLTPYIGAGVGASIVDPSVRVGGQSYSVSDDAEFAWALMAGVSYSIDNNIVIDLGYRHLDLGRYAFDLNGYGNAAFTNASFDRDFSRDEVRLGVRYMLY